MPVEKKNAKLRHWLVLLYSEHHPILLFLTKNLRKPICGLGGLSL